MSGASTVDRRVSTTVADPRDSSLTAGTSQNRSQMGPNCSASHCAPTTTVNQNPGLARLAPPLPSGRNQALSQQYRSPVPVMMRTPPPPASILRRYPPSASSVVKKVDFQQFSASEQMPLTPLESSTMPKPTNHSTSHQAAPKNVPNRSEHSVSPKSANRENSEPNEDLGTTPTHSKPTDAGGASTSSKKKKQRQQLETNMTLKKSPSKLFCAKDATMLAMFDDDDSDEENEAPPAAAPADEAPVKQPIRNDPRQQKFPSSPDKENSIAEEEPAILKAHTGTASLFQSSAFAGIDMDDMFDDDDD
jgi:hypothetical protein